MDLLNEVNRTHNTAIVLISHNLALISQNCHRVARDVRGRVVEELDADQLLTDPQHPYTGRCSTPCRRSAAPATATSRRSRATRLTPRAALRVPLSPALPARRRPLPAERPPLLEREHEPGGASPATSRTAPSPRPSDPRAPSPPGARTRSASPTPARSRSRSGRHAPRRSRATARARARSRDAALARVAAEELGEHPRLVLGAERRCPGRGPRRGRSPSSVAAPPITTPPSGEYLTAFASRFSTPGPGARGRRRTVSGASGTSTRILCRSVPAPISRPSSRSTSPRSSGSLAELDAAHPRAEPLRGSRRRGPARRSAWSRIVVERSAAASPSRSRGAGSGSRSRGCSRAASGSRARRSSRARTSRARSGGAARSAAQVAAAPSSSEFAIALNEVVSSRISAAPPAGMRVDRSPAAIGPARVGDRPHGLGDGADEEEGDQTTRTAAPPRAAAPTATARST